jgi:hypothetical protein
VAVRRGLDEGNKGKVDEDSRVIEFRECIQDIGFFCLRAVEIINYPRWRSILPPHSRRDEASISGYVSFIATKKAEQKASKMGYFIFSTALNFLDGQEK